MNPDPLRQISEEVQGKQISLCHILCSPDERISKLLGLAGKAVAILTLTPAEASIIAADFVTKAASVELVFVDRYLGTLLVTGSLSSVESALERVMAFLSGTMRFERIPITKS
ncbi:BMC domain-containing protein [Caproiciproducens sp.]